ncbi:MAG: preprotein translocase subunit SecA [Dictyoglomi bacterium]|nr:preprotein translocase subunit SecA [Dictyoglomota bacterium]
MLKLITDYLKKRELQKYWKKVERINALEPEIEKLSDDELKAKTAEFKNRLERGESLDSLLFEAFAVVREVAKRTLGMRHFDVQLIGGMVIHEGKVAEMKTGEGKTLVATLPAYLNALTGEGVHIVTVNEYLAKRDADWMRPVYEFLGITVDYLKSDMDKDRKKRAYKADVLYATNYELGFDYLRDNMARSPDEIVQRGLNYAIVDEADSILIDEARTPLIISGPAEEDTRIYYKVAKLARRMVPGVDFEMDEKDKWVTLTEKGIKKAERFLHVDNLYSLENTALLHKVIQAIRAEYLFKNEVDYIVKDGEVVIVDEFTGRLMYGRRYSDGLHQAIEAKEGVMVKGESVVYATISYQNFFRMYKKLAGMTGTAESSAEEFERIYGLKVVVIPTNKPVIRKDYPDVIYKTEKAKFDAVVREIEEMYKIGRPVLVGTRSIEKSEYLSNLLKKKGIPHQVLNAKYHEKEAEIIAHAGEKGMVTIATNMAGRGVDIKLGPGVKELGGLHIIGTERHEARRIDDQLRGRSGRQGDPGSTRFYLSLEDELMRLFGGESIKNLMNKLNIPDDEPIEHPMITRAVEKAQKRVENYHFDIRKRLLEYDNVLDMQRDIIYDQRRKILFSDNVEDILDSIIRNYAKYLADVVWSDELTPEEIVKKAQQELYLLTGKQVEWEGYLPEDKEDLEKWFEESIRKVLQLKKELWGEDVWKQVVKQVLLSTIDRNWIDHLQTMEQLRQGIGLRAFGQKDPLVEYQYEARNMFEMMLNNIRRDTIRTLSVLNLNITVNAPDREGRKG